jgi:hypothetical protein
MWTMAVDVDRRVMVAHTVRRGPTKDCAILRPVVDAAHQFSGLTRRTI